VPKPCYLFVLQAVLFRILVFPAVGEAISSCCGPFAACFTACKRQRRGQGTSRATGLLADMQAPAWSHHSPESDTASPPTGVWVAVVVVFWSLVVALVSVVMYLVHLGRLDAGGRAVQQTPFVLRHRLCRQLIRSCL